MQSDEFVAKVQNPKARFVYSVICHKEGKGPHCDGCDEGSLGNHASNTPEEATGEFGLPDCGCDLVIVTYWKVDEL